MHERDAVDKAGIQPLRADLERIAALTDRTDLATLLRGPAPAHESWGLFFGVYVQQDARDATKVIAALAPAASDCRIAITT